MAMNQQEIVNTLSRAYILDNTTVDEQVDFISDQIKQPFDSGGSNYFKKLKNMTKPDQLDQICMDLFNEIENVYPDLQIDYSNLDEHLSDSFSAVYKFFVRNVSKLFYIFLREYLYSSKNRKAVTADYVNTKLPNYPKEQYGKKEFYILINKLPSIIKDIFATDIRLEDFIDTVERSGSSPMYFRTIRELLDKGILIDHGVVSNMYDQFKKSDAYDATLCKLQMKITKELILPYLEENGLSDLRIPQVEDDTEEDSADEDEAENNEE